MIKSEVKNQAGNMSFAFGEYLREIEKLYEFKLVFGISGNFLKTEKWNSGKNGKKLWEKVKTH